MDSLGSSKCYKTSFCEDHRRLYVVKFGRYFTVRMFQLNLSVETRSVSLTFGSLIEGLSGHRHTLTHARPYT